MDLIPKEIDDVVNYQNKGNDWIEESSWTMAITFVGIEDNSSILQEGFPST